MSRRLIVEVTEEELKALDELSKEKTLDDLVDDLIGYLTNNKPDHVDILEGEPISPGFKHIYKQYEAKKFTVHMVIDCDLKGIGKLADIRITNRRKRNE